jgi:hypothetical protein
LGALDIALWGFFVWSAVSSALSYEPALSLDHLKGVSLFLIYYFVRYNVRRLGAVYFLAFALIISCMVNVAWVPIERLIGRGVEIHGIRPDSPFTKTTLIEGDTMLEANGKRLRSPDDLLGILERDGTAKVKFYRPDFYTFTDVKLEDLLPGTSADERLGIEGWKKSYNWRSQGFYGHYVTYAEVLQLILSLLFGMIVAALNSRSGRRSGGSPRFLNILLIAALGGMCLALLLTVTRASQLAFMISAFCILLAGANRRLVLAAIVVALPVVFGALLFLQQSRDTGFFDAKDESTRYRTVMWRDGMRIWTVDAHNFIFGVGMDSIKDHWQEWGMYEGGNLPMGHFHSTPVQLLVERGTPALLLWLAVLAAAGRIIWSGIKVEKEERRHGGGNTWSLGILLGTLGATIGFVMSGMVHYNLGDQEVAMVFFLLMGFGVSVAMLSAARQPDLARS